jgi:hypothetical protein
MKNWLWTNGFKGFDHLAYPGGAHDARVDRMASLYFSTGRLVVGISNESTYPSTPMECRAIIVLNTTPTATITALIDKAYSEGAWLHLIFHDFAAVATLSLQYSTANFATVIDYAATKGIPVCTVGDVWNSGA